MNLKYYISSIFSSVWVLFYLFAAANEDASTAIVFYITAFAGFTFIACLPLIIHVASIYTLKRKNDENWRHHLAAALIIVFSSIVFLFSISRGYVVAV